MIRKKKHTLGNNKKELQQLECQTRVWSGPQAVGSQRRFLSKGIARIFGVLCCFPFLFCFSYSRFGCPYGDWTKEKDQRSIICEESTCQLRHRNVEA